MSRARTATLLTLAALIAPGAVRAWGPEGHRITAQVAEDHLSDRARAGVRALLGDRSLARVSVWPDFVRSEPGWDFAVPWHYVTVEDDGSLDEVLERARATVLPDNVVEAIEFCTAVLRGDAARTTALRDLLVEHGVEPYGGSVEATALVFLVHLVADLHQPLHVGRGDDRGANNITVNWFGERTNLHWLWDQGIVEHEGLSYTEFTAFLEQDLGAEGPSLVGGTPADWAMESRRLRSAVYDIWSHTDRDNWWPDLGYAYAHDHIDIVERRLYQGGLRLAELLDSIFQ
jgi:nuclease S1